MQYTQLHEDDPNPANLLTITHTYNGAARYVVGFAAYSREA